MLLQPSENRRRDHKSSPPDLSWVRRAGRRVLRGLRPLAAPALNRFQLRLSTAIHESATAAAIRDIDHRLAAAEAVLADLRRTANDIRDTSYESRDAAEVSRHTAAESLRPIQALLEHHAALAEIGRQTTIRIERLQLGVDATRLDQQAADAETQAAFARLHAAIDAARTERQQEAVSSRDSSAAKQALIARVLQRADVLLQRVAIPLGPDVLVRTPDGFLLTPAEDERLLAAMYESGGRLEPGTVSVLSTLLRPGDWAVDVGAHIGTTVLPDARRVGPTGRIIAVEPASRVGALLRRNLALNGIEDRVSLHACAAGEQPGSAVLNLGAASGHSSLLPLPEADRTETVPVQTVDALVPPGQRVHVAKLDAEGFELPVWRGMRRIIADNPTLAVLVEFGPIHLRRAGVPVEMWLAEMLAPGFTAYEPDRKRG